MTSRHHTDGETSILETSSVAWLTPVFGVAGQSLYWKPLLNTFSKKCKNFKVYTGKLDCPGSDFQFPIESTSRLLRLYSSERSSRKKSTSNYASGINLLSPGVILQLTREHPALIICNEMGLMTLYGIIYKLVSFRRCKLLLIIESRPMQTGGLFLTTSRFLFRRLMANFSDAFLTNNLSGQQYIKKELGIQEKRIIKQPYLVSNFSEDGQSPKDSPDYGRGKKLKCLYVGQLIQRKGIHLALESIARLDTELQLKMQFDIVGDGPMRSRLEELTGELGLNSIVIFHGKQSYNDLKHFYAQAHALVFPTLADYRALSPFEALSAGLAILASIHDGGIDETVQDDKNGFRFDPNETDQLTEHLETIISRPHLITEFSVVSLQIATQYTQGNAVNSLVTACELALQE